MKGCSFKDIISILICYLFTMINPVELLKMQSEAKKMQAKMRERKIKGESKNGMVIIFMNGAQELEDVYIDEQYLDPDMAEAVRNAFKEAFKDYQKKLQKDMQQDINMDDIKRLLGK